MPCQAGFALILSKPNYMSKSIVELQQISSQVRRDIVRMVHAVNSGHPGGSLGCADLLVSLYFLDQIGLKPYLNLRMDNPFIYS
jgi:transketolase N-terminal domain/subunit